MDETTKTAPLDWIERGGYHLVFTEKQSSFQKSAEGLRKTSDFSFSLGLAIGKEGDLSSVQWGGPAFKAGITTATSSSRSTDRPSNPTRSSWRSIGARPTRSR